jgi:hypothetical protein
MMDIILSMPAFYLYLVFVVALLIKALWTRETGSLVGEPRATALTTGRGVADTSVAARCNLDPVPLPSAAVPPQCDRRLFRDLQATLSASYAAKWEQTIRTIWVGPPAGVRPTDQGAG